MFDNIYNHLKEELDKKKGELQDVIKKTKSVKEKRIQAQEKLLTLKQLANIEQQEFEKVYQEVYKTLDAENKTKHKEVYFEELKKLQEKDKQERKKRYGLLKGLDQESNVFQTETKDELFGMHDKKQTQTHADTKQTPEEIQR